MVASADQNSGTTTQIGSFVDVITARIPAPPAGAGQARLEMTLAVTTPGMPVALTAVSSPAARHAVLLTRGHATARINVPVQAGENVRIGPPAPDEVLLTGLRERLRLGQSVTVTMTFGRSGRATLAVPVTAAPLTSFPRGAAPRGAAAGSRRARDGGSPGNRLRTCGRA